MPSYQQQQICFFSSLKPAALCVFIRGVVEGEGNKDQGENLRNHVDSALEMGRGCQRLFMMCRSHFPESSNQQIGRKIGTICEAGRVERCEVSSQACPCDLNAQAGIRGVGTTTGKVA